MQSRQNLKKEYIFIVHKLHFLNRQSSKSDRNAKGATLWFYCLQLWQYCRGASICWHYPHSTNQEWSNHTRVHQKDLARFSLSWHCCNTSAPRGQCFTAFKTPAKHSRADFYKSLLFSAYIILDLGDFQPEFEFTIFIAWSNSNYPIAISMCNSVLVCWSRIKCHILMKQHKTANTS